MAPAFTLSFYDIATVIGLSSIVSGLVSAFINNYLTKKSIVREMKRNDTKKMVNAYTYILFDLERMLESTEFKTGREGDHKIEATFKEIDAIVKDNYGAIEPSIISKYFPIAGSNGLTLYKADRLKYTNCVRTFRNVLANNINEHIKKYRDMGISVTER